MLMPETSVNKNYLFPSREDQIRLARKVFPVQPVAVAHAMDKFPDHHFRLHAFAADGLHVGAALLRRDFVHGLAFFGARIDYTEK